MSEPGPPPGPTWADTAAEVTLAVSCQQQRHALRWRRGSVQLLDHPELEAELALVALGGAEPRCVSLLHLWNDAVADGGFLAEWVDESRLTAAWFSWLAMALERMRSEGFHEFLRGLPPARAQRMGQFLHAFPVPWIDRAAASVSAAVVDGDGVTCSQAPSLLSVAIANRLRRAFVDGVGGRQLSVGAAALVPLTISVSSAQGASARTVAIGEPSVSGSLTGPGRGVTIQVGPSWLHRVWACGAAVIDGRPTLALDRTSTDTPGDGTESPEWTDGGTHRAQTMAWERSADGRLEPVIETTGVRYVDGFWSPA